MKHLIAYAWFNSRTQIGIVCYYNDVKEFKAVIGNAVGVDLDVDLQDIADWGSKFPLDAAVLAIEQQGSVNDMGAWNELKKSLNPSSEVDVPVSREDVENVASRINKVVTSEQIDKVLEIYNEVQAGEPQSTWDIIVEQCLYHPDVMGMTGKDEEE